MTSSQAMEAETRTGPLDGLTERLSPHPVVAGLSSGILLWSAFPPVEWSWLAWIALVPLFWLVIQTGTSAAALPRGMGRWPRLLGAQRAMGAPY